MIFKFIKYSMNVYDHQVTFFSYSSVFMLNTIPGLLFNSLHNYKIAEELIISIGLPAICLFGAIWRCVYFSQAFNYIP